MFDFEENSTVKISEKLKARFCKDSNIPIKVYSEPYFENFIRLFDNQYGTIEKYREFVRTVQDFGSEEAFLSAYNKLKDDVIEYLSNNQFMQKFNEEDVNRFVIKNTGITEKDIYHKDNDGQFFVSIDMIKANFTALYHYNSAIFANKSTYEEFMKMFTDVQYFIDSKHIRQVIFGKLNNKRQIRYEKYLMDLILDIMLNTGEYITLEDVCSFSHDEIVIRFRTSLINFIKGLEMWANKHEIFIRCECFQLKAIPGTKGFVRKFLDKDKGMDFKCVDSLSLPFVLRVYNNEEPNELDRVFIHDGKKAQLLENIEVEAV